MIKVLIWLIYIGVGAAAIALSVANREPVPVSLAPLPYIFEIPMYFLFFIFAALGLFLAGLGGIVRQGIWRHRAKKAEKLVLQLEAKLDDREAERERAQADIMTAQAKLIAAQDGEMESANVVPAALPLEKKRSR